MKREIYRLVAVAAVCLPLSFMTGGCAKQKVQSESGMIVTDVPKAKETTAPAKIDTGEGMGQEESLESKPYADQSDSQILEGRTTGPMLPVYFDFDKSNIREDQKDRIAKNTEFLKDNTSVTIRIEGNCDERGTNEYNMALGERRATAGKKYLVNSGVAAARIGTISFGEEKPLNYGHDELSWSQNRRDDFVILSR